LFPKAVILASTSRYRRELLGRLRLPFTCVAPDIDETPQAGEPAVDLAMRLASSKAAAVLGRHPGAIVIGSDQVAVRDTEILGKPGTVEACRRQLRRCSGQAVEFITAVHVIDGTSGAEQSHVDVTRVRFRDLTPGEIDRYIEHDQPLDCAGSFKAESLGIALFDRIESVDPTGLVGLPLAWVAAALRHVGIDVP
jgi:septum formation protein